MREFEIAFQLSQHRQVLLEEHSGEEAQRNLWNSGQGSGLRSWIRYLEHLSLGVQRRE